jgi:energy-coupling factor transporter transmembrane protein EcfT
MSESGVRPLAPSSKLALYLACLAAAYVVPDPVTVMVTAGVVLLLAGIIVMRARRPVPRLRWRAALVFIAWVFLMRLALELVSGVPLADAGAWLLAGRQAARVAVLAVGVIALLAATTARDVVDELEHSRLPRALRLLVMMLVQYPRVLRDRYDQIVEAQVARGAERPRSIVQRATHGAALLLPVMQSELNAVGERAALIHLRGLDVEVRASGAARSTADLVAIGLASIVLVIAIVIRFAR